MPYLLNTPDQRREMLDTIGVDAMSTLLAQIPADLQLHRPLHLPAALTELELEQHLRQLAAM